MALTFDNDGAENQTRPESVNFTVADGKVYAAFVATGKVKLSNAKQNRNFQTLQRVAVSANMVLFSQKLALAPPTMLLIVRMLRM